MQDQTIQGYRNKHHLIHMFLFQNNYFDWDMLQLKKYYNNHQSIQGDMHNN